MRNHAAVANFLDTSNGGAGGVIIAFADQRGGADVALEQIPALRVFGQMRAAVLWG